MNAILHDITRGTSDLELACRRLAKAKLVEAEATLTRHTAEREVIELFDNLPVEGTTHQDAGDLRATVTTGLRRKVDADKLAEIANVIPEAIGKRLIRWKPELVTRELRFVESNEPEISALLAHAITITPSKPSVKVELIKREGE